MLVMLLLVQVVRCSVEAVDGLVKSQRWDLLLLSVMVMVVVDSRCF